MSIPLGAEPDQLETWHPLLAMTRATHSRWVDLGGVHIDADVEGRDFQWEIEGQLVRLRIPHRDEPLEDDFTAFEAWGGNAMRLRTVELTVEFETGIDLDEVDIHLNDEALERTRADVDAAEELLMRVAVELRGVARLEQPWLGLGDAPIRSRRVGPVRRLDARGGMVGVAPTHHERAYFLEGPGPTVSGQDLAGFGRRFGRYEDDDVTRGLLSDARYLATWQDPPNLQRALLLAAVACEVQAKRVLQRKAAPGARPLAEWLFTNQRSFPYSALDLYGPIADRLTGHTLARDDPDTHKLLQRLFHMRNDVAHNAGEPADEDQAKASVAAGRRAFAWLDALPEMP